jgi:hypothetical protein
LNGAGGPASLALDHVVLLCDAEAAGPTAVLRSHGLAESYRRVHPGQGTANVCFAFDNAFVELLWVTDRDALVTPEVAPIGLAARADWRRTGACPIGVAVRCAGDLPFATWPYRAPFLPPGVAIDVAADSRDPAQPFVFRAPDARAPADRPEIGDRRQIGAGFSRLGVVTILGPRPMNAGAALGALAAANLVAAETWNRSGWGLTLDLERIDGTRHAVCLDAP